MESENSDLQKEEASKEKIINLHTDASASIVHGFNVEGTDQQKDLAAKNNPGQDLVLPVRQGDDIHTANQWDIPRALSGNEKLVNLTAFTFADSPIDGKPLLPKNLLETYKTHDAVYDELLFRASEHIALVTNHIELKEVMNSDKLGMIQSIEGVYGDYTEQDIEKIAEKVKIWTIWWNASDPKTGTDASTSLTEQDTGLTDQGKALVSMLSKDLKVAVDLSHASDNTAKGVLEVVAEIGGVPAIATHSGSREVLDHKRNLPDSLAIDIASQDGIIGLPFTGTFMKDIDGVVKTATHFKNLGILDHVALGPDFDGMPSHRAIPQLKDAETAGKNIAEIFKQAGFTQDEIDGILFENAFKYMGKYLFAPQK